MIPPTAVFDQRYALVFLVAFTSLQFGFDRKR